MPPAQPENPTPPWPEVPSKAPTRQLGFIDRVLRQHWYALLEKLWSGSFSEQDEADFRACDHALYQDPGMGLRGGNSNVYSAISTNGGQTWEPEDVVCIAKVGVPHRVVLPDGTIKMVAVDHDTGSIISSRGVAGRLVLAESRDGIHFTRDPNFRIVDIYVRDTIDPDIVVLPDGSLRIYYLVPVHTQFQEGRHLTDSSLSGCILSAISWDGSTFYQEPGIRYANPHGIIDPTYFPMDDSTWGLYGHVHAKNLLYGATSKDGGLTFTPNKGDYVFRGALVTVRPVPGGFRMWYRDPDQPPAPESAANIWGGRLSAFSTDGVHWQQEPEFQWQGIPTVVSMPDGRLRRYYSARPGQI